MVMMESFQYSNDMVNLSEEQVLLLKLSELDILEGKLISQEELDRDDMEWLSAINFS